MKKYKYIISLVLNTVILFSVSCATTNNKDTSLNAKNKDNSKTPFLTAPKVRKVWIPEKIENDKFIEGHYMWILEKTSSWSQ